eukprot:4226522-Alexandrium_andersonii.AAC.1
MSASLVGSEMCIRDSSCSSWPLMWPKRSRVARTGLNETSMAMRLGSIRGHACSCVAGAFGRKGANAQGGNATKTAPARGLGRCCGCGVGLSRHEHTQAATRAI